MSETLAVSFVALLLLSFVFVTYSCLGLRRRQVSRELLAMLGLVYFAVVLSAIVLQAYRAAPPPTPKSEPLFYGPTDWTPKGNPGTGIGSILFWRWRE
jgi:hypothetical protein